MRTVWLSVVAVLVTGVVPVCAAEEAKMGIALYDGKPGAKKFELRINPMDGAKMVWVPAGEFLMGSTDKDIAAMVNAESTLEDLKEGFDPEKPQRKVYLDGYWMYKCEVTVAQYRKFCKATKRKMPKTPDWGWRDNHPMVMVTWQDAADYAKWAGVSLPTEAQWEKAARGTDGRVYPWGNKWDASKCANDVVEWDEPEKLESTKPVGSYASGVSSCGCMDMAGNASEWCADWFDPNYYKNAPTKNPTGPKEPVKFQFVGRPIEARVLRGGSWISGLVFLYRCADRNIDRGPTEFYGVDRGFRCAGTP